MENFHISESIQSNIASLNRQIWGRMLADERVVVEIPKKRKRKLSEDEEVLLFEKKYMNFGR